MNMTGYVPLHRYCLGLVLFNPQSDSYTASIHAALDFGLIAIVVDNSKPEEQERNYQTTVERFPRQTIKYLREDGNIGLSAAYNKILRVAERLGGIEGIIFLDQDSMIATSSISSLVEVYERESSSGPVGVIAGMAMRNEAQPWRIYAAGNKRRNHDHIIELEMAPSSFSLVSLSAIRRIGGFYDDFFIDQIDRDFCLRCHRAGLLVAMTKKATFLHKIGEGEVTVFGTYLCPISAPFRHYFQVRNIILSAKRGGATWVQAAIEILKRFIVMGVVGICAGTLVGRYRFAFRGLLDGFRNRGGPMK